jgi:hypothetical protein
LFSYARIEIGCIVTKRTAWRPVATSAVAVKLEFDFTEGENLSAQCAHGEHHEAASSLALRPIPEGAFAILVYLQHNVGHNAGLAHTHLRFQHWNFIDKNS